MCFWLQPLNLNINVAVNVTTKVSITHHKLKRKRTKRKQTGYNNNLSHDNESATASGGEEPEEQRLTLMPRPQKALRAITGGAMIGKGGGAGGGGSGPTTVPGGLKASHMPMLGLVHLLLLLCLTFCCDVNCKSNQSLLTPTSATTTMSTIGDVTSNDRYAAVDANFSNELVTEECRRRCEVEAHLFQDEFGTKCALTDESDKCYKQRCHKGCAAWLQALHDYESCQEACSVTAFYPYDLPCISACELGQHLYWYLQRLALAPLVQTIKPQLLTASGEDNKDNDAPPTSNSGSNDDSLMGISLRLKWPITLPDNYLNSRPFNIQYTYANITTTGENDANGRTHKATLQGTLEEPDATTMLQWHYLADYNCNEQYDCKILDGLMPFTSYRFRFELTFGDAAADILHSPASELYTTAASGVPISPPSVINALAMDHSHVAVFWQPGQFANGPLKGYKLVLASENHTEEVFLPPDVEQHIFSDLLTRISYNVSIAMVNTEGEGPSATLSVATKELVWSPATVDELQVVWLAGTKSFTIRKLQAQDAKQSFYWSETELTDYAFYEAKQQLFFLDAAGTLKSFYLSNYEDSTTIEMENGLNDYRPQKMSLDWLNQKLYFACKDSHSQAENWVLVSTDFEGRNLEILNGNITAPVEQLDVDPINGWLFWRTRGINKTAATLGRLNLANKNAFVLLSATQIGYFINDYQRFMLLVYNHSAGALFELSYDGLHRQQLKLNLTRILQGEVVSFRYQAGALMVSNNTHFAFSNQHNGEQKIWETRVNQDRIQNFWPIAASQERQALPAPPSSDGTSQLQALMSAHVAHITWQAPARKPFQTAAAWQQWEYELEIMDVASNSAFNIRNIKSRYFNVEKLQANNLYKLRVRATAVATAATTTANVGLKGSATAAIGAWSPELLARTWPLGVHKLWWASGASLYETDELGADLKHIATLPHAAAGLRSFIQLNGTLYYASEAASESEMAGHLRCANIMNPEVNCTFHGHTAISVAYDWRAGKVYWADKLRNCVIRANLLATSSSDPDGQGYLPLVGEQRELLPIFGVQQLEIDAENGLLYYSTGKRLMRRTLNGLHDTEELEYFHVNGMGGGQIRAFTLASEQQQLYWIVQQAEGHIRLFNTSLELPQQLQENFKLTDKLLAHDVQTGALIYLRDIESLLWLERNANRAVILRTDTLKDQATMTLPKLQQLNVVQLKTDYVPYRDVSVVPEAINVSSIEIADGYWDDFRIRWLPIATAENHTVFYKVLLEYTVAGRERLYSTEVTESLVRIREFHQPQLQLTVSITPHTYWQAGPTTQAQLLTPAAAPTQPKRLRIFVERAEQPFQSSPNVSAWIRWDPPDNISSTSTVTYKVYCWKGAELFTERVYNHSSTDRPLETLIEPLQIGETYIFQVQAFAGSRSSAGERTALHAVHINPEVQSVPRLLYATAEHIAELDLDLQSHKVLVHTSSEVEHLTVMQGEQRLLWVNENVELMSCVRGSAPIKLARMRAEVLALTVDWITRIVYWVEVATNMEQAVSLYKLDLCQFEGRVMMGTKIYTTEQGKKLKDLIVLPYAQALVWLETAVDERYALLVGRNLTNDSELNFRAPDALVRMFEGSFSAEQETVNLVDHKNQVCAYDLQRELCTPLKTYFNDVTEQLQDVQRDTGYIYTLQNDTLRAYDRRKQSLEYEIGVWNVRRIRAYNQQEYPQAECLLPTAEQSLRPTLLVEEERYFTLGVPQLHHAPGCWLPVPGYKYKLSIWDAKNSTRHLSSTGPQINVTSLEPFTNYTLQLSATSFYHHKLGHSALNSKLFIVHTAVGVPSQPLNFSARPLSPTEIAISWLKPEVLNCDKAWYQLHWQFDNAIDSANITLENTAHRLRELPEGKEYIIWLQVHCSAQKFNTTAKFKVTTFDLPANLLEVEIGAYNMTLAWAPIPQISQAVLVCQAINDVLDEFSVDMLAGSEEFSSNNTLVVIPNLKPKTRYEFYLKLLYENVTRPYSVRQARFAFETLGDHPSSPGKPHIEYITGETFKVFWEPALNNGAPIAEYQLEAFQAHKSKRIRRSSAFLATEEDNKTQGYLVSQHGHQLSQLPWVEEPQPIEDKWIVYCNTTELSCIVREMHTQRLHMFRVRARNEPYGWGPYSEDSQRVNEPYVSAEKRDSLIFAILAPAAIVSSFVIVLIVVKIVQKRRVRAKKVVEKSRPSIWSNLSTLQQQQLMVSRQRAFSVTSTSTAYGLGPLSDADIELLPHINWNQITLLNFLGSGAFGEVYEGLVTWDDDSQPEKVAIKSLRKGASEFSELLQEAQLMSNFRHENIVRLIGICFDTESISLVMEHMGGGDLLTYLRESRPNLTKPHASLQVLELLTMCIDVATGCAYLEDMHFVHRDLACRNCLVSSREPSKRVVKIGDFGLARDIYKNDYYRKEGEGLLPVRWMAPESLVDGLFTTQSDVWAFAVLCWEIFTLGQQPYAARNNFEVLSYVKESGRLEQPDNCPDKLYALWLECWHDDPEQRPTFRKCRNVLISNKTDVRRISLGSQLYDGDYHIYANHHDNSMLNDVVLTSFLAHPLPKVTEEEEELQVDLERDEDGSISARSTSDDSVASSSQVNEKPELRVHFEAVASKECDYDTVADNSQLIYSTLKRGGRRQQDDNDEEPNYYINEGVSRF